jgi:bifunctional DNase/RNase
MIEMRIVGVRVEMPNQQPILLLTESAGERSLPIMIGSAEATAIAMHLQGMRPPRPLTHDLLKDTVAALGRTLAEVRVVDFREGTFYGELVFDDEVTVSARPSDAVALAVRCEAPVFAAEAVLEEAGIVIPDDEGSEDDAEESAPITDPEGEMERFREFLDNVSPEDFGPEQQQ